MLFICTDYAKVALEDDIYVQQCAEDPEYAIFLFKKQHSNNKDVIIGQCKAKASIAPSSSTVYLQIYNRNSGSWETIDSDSTTGANTKFELLGTQSTNLSYYYDAENWVAFRVFQEAKLT